MEGWKRGRVVEGGEEKALTWPNTCFSPGYFSLGSVTCHEEHAYDLGVPSPSQPPRLHGPHDQVHCHDAVDQLAQGLAVRPVKTVEDVGGPEGEAAQKSEVGQSQVAQVDLGYRQAILVRKKHAQDEGVQGEAQHGHGDDVRRDNGAHGDELQRCEGL
uniref:Uncharacterized protein n=1 Tax=Hippocampus comes TaxID=109280 RepID=A0A3Q2YJ19_HIPCM